MVNMQVLSGQMTIIMPMVTKVVKPIPALHHEFPEHFAERGVERFCKGRCYNAIGTLLDGPASLARAIAACLTEPCAKLSWQRARRWE
ncbi:MAG: hypothetical protein WCA12_16125 [Burkholderiales bacterium]